MNIFFEVNTIVPDWKIGRSSTRSRGATAVKYKVRGEKSDPGAGSRAPRGTKTNAAMTMYMSNEYRYLKSILLYEYKDLFIDMDARKNRSELAKANRHQER